MSKSGFKATSLRSIMILLFVILLFLSIGGFYYQQGELRTLANDVNSSKSESPSDKSAAVKAVGIISSDTNYQNIIDKDLDTYGETIGGGNSIIESVSFKQTQSADTLLEPRKVKVYTVEVAFKNNRLEYSKLISFIKAIESNTPKMNITSLTLSRPAEQKNMVTVKPITIEIYAR